MADKTIRLCSVGANRFRSGEVRLMNFKGGVRVHLSVDC
jgi:hypothetical protein